ncbi:hypothetical protein ASC94_03550 [Massilia sp. Root418]|uniref:DUF4259 domain-containing protein n=1 Tax=Massilia sp. Root418 TaxID=1736532 RepID=UPI0006F6F77B|nr:DUF4259 domain-containing protein [Massilia sp. Root418]KQX01692.1 hypothetical protein ASC94_03550 [Massilia sp. Root418]
MGTWAVDAFGNDFALDWAQDLQESKDLFFIEDTLNNVLSPDSADYLEAPFAAEGLAAIEVLARLYGKPGAEDENTKDVDAWVEEVSKKATKRRADLIEKSQRAIGHILSERSELRELWQDSEHYEDWRASVDELKQRISASAGE